MNEPQTAFLDPAVFRQVWRRVMPQDRMDCPFTLPEPFPPSPVGQEPPCPPAPTLAPAPPAVCLAEASAPEVPALAQLLGLCVGDHRIYRVLAQKRTQAASLFASLREDKRRQARRLSAAHFLITGRTFQPAPTPAPASQSLPQLLRSRFHSEQDRTVQLLSAASVTADPCLAQLYTDLAQETRSFAQRLRAQLEKG